MLSTSSLHWLVSLPECHWLASLPECATSGDGEPDGVPGSPSPRVAACGRAIAARGQIGQERQREVHDLSDRDPERTPFGRQGGDQYQPMCSFGNGWFVQRHRPGTRRVVEVNAQMTAGAPDGK